MENSGNLPPVWDVSSITVYGVTVTLLVIAIVFLWRENLKARSDYTSLLKTAIQVMEAFTTKYDGDGKELADVKLEATLRGVVQQEVATALNHLHLPKSPKT